MTWVDRVAVVVLFFLLPALAVAQARALPQMKLDRLGVYLSSAVSLFLLGAGAWALGVRHGGGAALGLVALPWGAFALWTVALVAGGLAVTLVFRWIGGALGAREAPVLRALLPRSRGERAAFLGVSLAAGIGEELAYRGYALLVLTPVLGSGGAVAVSSAVFGVLHAYQGPVGVARTAVLGGILAGGYLASGSLWPTVAAHAILDVILGVALAERMMLPEEAAGTG